MLALHNLQKLDEVFPHCIFFYGILVVFVGESRWLKKLTFVNPNVTQNSYFQGFMAHQGLAWICFWVGGLWSLQNLLF
jgi:hypothetical protein